MITFLDLVIYTKNEIDICQHFQLNNEIFTHKIAFKIVMKKMSQPIPNK